MNVRQYQRDFDKGTCRAHTRREGEGRGTDTHIERDETHIGGGDAEIGREPYDWEGEREREK